jgi:signal peptidase
MTLRRLLRSAALLAGTLVVAGFVALQLPWSPVRSMVVSGTSMEPSLAGGDIVVTVRRSGYRRGELVAFRIRAGEPGAGGLVIHRIVGGNGTHGYVTRGDNRESIDPWRPRDPDVVGEAAVDVPRLGALVALLRTPFGMATLAALVTITSIGQGGRKQQPAEDPKPIV